jgi:hypothetical protein
MFYSEIGAKNVNIEILDLDTLMIIHSTKSNVIKSTYTVS